MIVLIDEDAIVRSIRDTSLPASFHERIYTLYADGLRSASKFSGRGWGEVVACYEEGYATPMDALRYATAIHTVPAMQRG
ncbi:hypothetical protein [Pararoseomonas baculiformis]|uniref:hypothetical protein n=1 Tax=Pararoseomonas baculiformis TaxID=2820812 RepID=UPI001AE0A209|nr:hypothetical protein [Pararoseomonas baculiformis]